MKDWLMTRSKQRLIIITVTAIVFLTILPLATSDVQALYRRRLRHSTASTSRSVNTSHVGVSVKLRSDRRALILNLSNLQLTNSTSYLLTYNANGTTKGSQGVIRSDEGSTTSREILFGTCSAGVCTYHSGISNMRFTVTIKQKNGYTIIRPYRVRP